MVPNTPQKGFASAFGSTYDAANSRLDPLGWQLEMKGSFLLPSIHRNDVVMATHGRTEVY